VEGTLIVAVAELLTHPRRAPFDGLFGAEQIAPPAKAYIA